MVVSLLYFSFSVGMMLDASLNEVYTIYDATLPTRDSVDTTSFEALKNE